MDVVTDIGEQSRIAQLLQPKIIDEQGKGELALIQSSSPDGKNAAGAANPANARMMSRRSTNADRSGCDQRRGQSSYRPKDHNLALSDESRRLVGQYPSHIGTRVNGGISFFLACHLESTMRRAGLSIVGLANEITVIDQ
jgi:hypothetical protein